MHAQRVRNAGRLMRKAADVLEDREWTTGVLGNPKSGMCMLGALYFTVCGNARPSHHQPLARDVDTLFTSWAGVPIPLFNDCKAKSKEEVLEIMRKFADEFDPIGTPKNARKVPSPRRTAERDLAQVTT